MRTETTITLRIVHGDDVALDHSNPAQWDWRELIGLSQKESVSVLSSETKEYVPAKPVEVRGIAYFSLFEEARDFGAMHGHGHPAWRAVRYERGWAVQVRPSGPYLNAKGEVQ